MRTATSAPAAALICAGCVCASCGSQGTPASQSTPAGPSAAAGARLVTLSGTVFELGAGGRTPAPHWPLQVVVGPPPGISGTYSYHQLTTDSSGRYTTPEAIAGFFAVAHAGGHPLNYAQPCVAAVQLIAGTELEIQVVSRTSLPASVERRPLVISGQVYETTPTGRSPVSGASIAMNWQPDTYLYGGTVVTDADGRYSFCGIPSGWNVEFEASKPGYDFASGWQRFSADTDFDIELKRVN